MTRAPRVEANGVPLCSRSDCPKYDGKHCREIGRFIPDVICGPEVAAMAEQIERLTSERDRAASDANMLANRDADWQHATGHSSPSDFLTTHTWSDE